jgi:hypothetical protein
LVPQPFKPSILSFIAGGIVNQGWVKLYRKLLDNEIWHHDPTAWRVFEYFLLTVNKDTGKRTFGRFQVSEFLDMNPNTLYKALQRLKNAKMVTLTSNNKYSTIYILKWHSYQGNGNTSQQQQSNNKVTLNKNKELRSIKDFPDNVKKIAEILNVKPTEGLDRYLNDLYKRYTFKSLTITMVQWCEDNKVEPTIARWMNWVRKAERSGELETRDR